MIYSLHYGGKTKRVSTQKEQLEIALEKNKPVEKKPARTKKSEVKTNEKTKA